MPDIQHPISFDLSKQYSTRRSLLGTPPWLIEHYKVEAGELNVSGWAIAPHDEASFWTFTVNGRLVEVRYPLSTPSLEKVFPFCSGATHAGFDLTISVTAADYEAGYLEIAFVNGMSKLPSSDYLNQFICLKDSIKSPNGEQLLRTQGNRSLERYRLHGYTTYRRLELLMRRHGGTRLSEFQSILDWGCGCGRLTQQFVAHLPQSSIYGVDIDEPNVHWCQRNIANAHFKLVGLLPPTMFNEGFFDFIVGISVMTHLDLATQLAWLGELKRITRKGGWVVLTTHGEAALARVQDFGVIEKTLAIGNDASTLDVSLSKIVGVETDYYRASYHLQRFVHATFSQYFDVVDIIPAANASIQDFILLKRV